MRRIHIIIFALFWATGTTLNVAGRDAGKASDGSSFSIAPSYVDKDLYDLHERLQKQGKPQFVTVDLTLHTAHLLFDYSLRAIEIERLYDLAEKLSKGMAENVRLSLPHGKDPLWEERRALWAYFCVPATIFDPAFEVPEEVKELVRKARFSAIMNSSGPWRTG